MSTGGTSKGGGGRGGVSGTAEPVVDRAAEKKSEIAMLQSRMSSLDKRQKLLLFSMNKSKGTRAKQKILAELNNEITQLAIDIRQANAELSNIR